MRKLFVLVFLAGCFCAACARAQEERERNDLLPQPGKWQTYPSDVGDVMIDRTGRPWFMLRKFDSALHVQQQVERGVKLRAPFVTARILLFDTTGRIWVSARQNLLLGYDPKAGQWIRRESLKTLGRGQADPIAAHQFSGPAVEDASGRLFFAEGSGCHVFDHGTWAYQPFYELNLTKGLFEGSEAIFGTPRFGQDPAGERIYAWTPWFTKSGTLGFWVFEAGAWRQLDTTCGSMEGRISALVPLERRRVLVCPQLSPAFIESVPPFKDAGPDAFAEDVSQLDNPSFPERRAAQRRLLDRGPGALPELRKAKQSARTPEIRIRLSQAIAILEKAGGSPLIDSYRIEDARLCGYDERGSAILRAGLVTTPEGKKIKDALWNVDPRGEVRPAPAALTNWLPSDLYGAPGHGLFAVSGLHGLGLLTAAEMTPLSEGSGDSFEQIYGRDSAGRLYLRSRTQTLAFDAGGQETRRTLPVSSYETATRRDIYCQDSDGRTVASITRANPLVLSVFRHGQWEPLPTPNGLDRFDEWIYLQPLRGGKFVAREARRGRFCLFDGTQWKNYQDLQSLVQENYRSLRDEIDNHARAHGTGVEIRTDTSGNIWCVEWDKATLYNGQEWTEWRPAKPSHGHSPGHVIHCIPYDCDQRVLLQCDFQIVPAHAENGRLVAEAPLPGRPEFATNRLNDLVVDTAGRALLAEEFGTLLVVDGNVSRIEKDAGVPRLQDSFGRIWRVDAPKKRLTIQTPSGTPIDFPDDSLTGESGIVEDSPGSYWVGTGRGLLHLLGKTASATAPQREGGYYDRDVPRVSMLGMWLDSDRNLWIPQADHIYRVELP